MSTKGKAKYNRAIALAKLDKANRLIHEVKRRWMEDGRRWEFAEPEMGYLLFGVANTLNSAIGLEVRAQTGAKK